MQKTTLPTLKADGIGYPDRSKSSGDLAVTEFKKMDAMLARGPDRFRPLSVLHATTNHLMQNVLPTTTRPFWETFAFIRDRLRAISQELTVQVCIFVC